MEKQVTTEEQYRQVLQTCRDIFSKKTRDYGTAWRILRLSSITDQIFIKAGRIRSIQEKGQQKISDDVATEFVGIVNYCLIALMQLEMQKDSRLELPEAEVMQAWDQQAAITLELMQHKNHDYGEVWRQMRVSSITDIILMKLLRVKQIEENSGKTLVSEGVGANYRDMLNYSVFSLILLQEAQQNQ